MKVYFATDHAGFDLKEELVEYVRDELGHDVVDLGAETKDPKDDYPSFMKLAAESVAGDGNARGIILGASGQGEAMVANRFPGVRAAVYYGPVKNTQTDEGGIDLDIISSTRKHNDANMLSIGARYVDSKEAKRAIKLWLETEFSSDERHIRRIGQIEEK
jgi:ribose 5-phosphate isomerase B